MTQHTGLTMKKAKELQMEYGKNEISVKLHGKILKKLIHIFSEPIYLLLTSSAIIYYLLGEPLDGLIMIAFVIFVIGIDVIQDARTGNALRKLKEISTPKIRVLREGNELLIPGEELVPGDIMFINEGVKIPADGYILEAAGLCVDESVLSGEATGVWKRARSLSFYMDRNDNSSGAKEENEESSGEMLCKRDYVYTGTFVVLGTGTILVEKIGNMTEYGKIADKIAKAPTTFSPLQKQMKKLAKQCTCFAAILFIFVSSATFINLSGVVLSERIIHSFLAGVVLALSMVPGEFPVILSVFLSMGALRLARKKALIRSLPAVETLGAISVLCMDKTGTITMNRMRVMDCYIADRQENKFCRIMKMACKDDSFDPVEKAILEFGDELCNRCNEALDEVSACDIHKRKSSIIKEYVFTNELKAMGQVWQDNDKIIIAVKGAPESILSLCYLSKEREELILEKIKKFLDSGLRVLAIADRTLEMDSLIPDSLKECRLVFRGIIGLSDPPREGIADYMKACNTAGIRVVMITGDHPLTASSIAKAVGIKNSDKVITGQELSVLSEEELRECVKECNLYARVLPLHKMRIVKALKDNGERVAMTGDGVNDSPALKIADIGIAMAKHGSEVCREAADLILLDDNLTTILDSIEDGRRIYQNIIKTIQYIFAIHIPIALASLAAPMLGVGPGSLLLLPLHIVLLELIMDPMCSIALERQPAQDDILKLPPRSTKDALLTKKRLYKSILQGLMIFLFSFGSYFTLLKLHYPSELARTMGFSILVMANIFLVIVNCSEREYFYQTLKKVKKDRGIWLVNLITMIGLGIMIYSPLSGMLGFTPLGGVMLLLVMFLSALSVLWYEVVKMRNNLKNKRED